MRPILCLLICIALSAHARTWTSRNGKTIEAEFGGYRNGVVILTKDDGTKGSIKLDALSKADQLVALKAYLAASKPTDAGPVSLVVPTGFTAADPIHKGPSSFFAFGGPRRPEGTAASLVITVLDPTKLPAGGASHDLFRNAMINGRKIGLDEWKDESGTILTAALGELPIVSWSAKRRAAKGTDASSHMNGFIAFFLQDNLYVAVSAQDVGFASDYVEACKDAVRTLQAKQ